MIIISKSSYILKIIFPGYLLRNSIFFYIWQGIWTHEISKAWSLKQDLQDGNTSWHVKNCTSPFFYIRGSQLVGHNPSWIKRPFHQGFLRPSENTDFFILQFISVSTLHLRSRHESNFMVRVNTTWETALKGISIRRVENYWPRWRAIGN